MLGTGLFSLYRGNAGQPEFVDLVPFRRISTIRRGNQPNRFELVCQGTAIRVFVNGIQEAALEDSTHQGEGDISVGGVGFAIVGGELDWRIDLRLDNLLVIRR
jgi:hypothetical protein